MFFLLSGEGSTDMGVGNMKATVCEGDHFLVGPMAIIVDNVVAPCYGFSILDVRCCGYVSKRHVTNRAGKLKAAKKELRIPGKKQARETLYFYNNARLLSRIARDQEKKRGDQVIAVLFRDSDETASAGRGIWAEKRKAMLNGFEKEGFSRGVPMIPKPKSEAWLICALKDNAYQNCQALEDRSGNDNSPNALKDELATLLGEEITRDSLCETVRISVNIDKIKMLSFKAFRERLEEVLFS
jgi:hypothetical protein